MFGASVAIGRIILPCLLCLLVARAPEAQTRPAGALTPQIESVLKSIKAADTEQYAVSEEDGRFLRVLVAARGAKSVLEIGAASGYSGIWVGMGLRETGGRLTTIEFDPVRAKAAAANIRAADRRLLRAVTKAYGDYGFGPEDAKLRAELTFAAGIGLLHLAGSAQQAQQIAQRERFLELMLKD